VLVVVVSQKDGCAAAQAPGRPRLVGDLGLVAVFNHIGPGLTSCTASRSG
jgi:hypothetical protein